jgi:hypothetical protein
MLAAQRQQPSNAPTRGETRDDTMTVLGSVDVSRAPNAHIVRDRGRHRVITRSAPPYYDANGRRQP